jgi:hypothetical protein
VACVDWVEVLNGSATIQLQAEVSGSDDTYLWTVTPADAGVFTAPDAAVTGFNVTTNTWWPGSLVFNLVVEGPDQCTFSDSEDFELEFPTQIIPVVKDGWRGISSYVDKSASTVPEVMDMAEPDELIIMYNRAGTYYWTVPTPPVNQLGLWQPIGYKAKFYDESCIPIYGDVVTELSVTVPGGAGFIYLPVPTNVVSDINDILGPYKEQILLVYDWEAGELWNEFTGTLPGDLTQLVPGKSYLYVKKASASEYTVTFPAFDAALGYNLTAKGAVKNLFVENSPWNEVVNTGETHFIFFAEQAANMMQPGDVLGAFNGFDLCVGVSEYGSKDSYMKLLAMGNDPLSDVTNGFEIGENMTFKVYRPSSGETFDVTFTYDVQYPNYDNTFEVNGVSLVSGMTMTATSVGNMPTDLNVSVFPNPAIDQINIVSDYSIKNIELVNYVGQTVYNEPVSGNSFQINVSNYSTGMYFVRIETIEGNVITKRIAIK